MAGILKPHERLVYAGKTELRAPDGTPLEGVPQYIIVSADEADPASVEALQENERFVLAGTVHIQRKTAEERFAAALEGRARPCADGTPLYIKEAADNVSKKTGLSAEEEKACKPLIGDLLEAFAMTARKMKALERQGKGAKA